MKKQSLTIIFSITAAFGIASAAFAHGGANGIVKERMDLMGELGKSMKGLGVMMKGEQPYDPAKVTEYAKRIGMHGGERMTSLFPEGSTQMPTEALPSVWSDWDSFKKLAEELSLSAKLLEEAADNPAKEGINGSEAPSAAELMGVAPTADNTAALTAQQAFKKVANNCSSCHKDFRKEKKQ